MRKLKILGMGLVVLGTFGALTQPRSPVIALARAEEPAKANSELDENQSPSWLARFFADDDRGPRWRVRAKKEKDRLEKERLENESAKKAAPKQGKKSGESEAKEASKHDQDAAAIKREQAAYLRRLAVCDQLREIALKNNDDDLNRQADELQSQAWEVYSRHVGAISAGLDPKSGFCPVSQQFAPFGDENEWGVGAKGLKEAKP